MFGKLTTKIPLTPQWLCPSNRVFILTLWAMVSDRPSAGLRQWTWKFPLRREVVVSISRDGRNEVDGDRINLVVANFSSSSRTRSLNSRVSSSGVDTWLVGVDALALGDTP